MGLSASRSRRAFTSKLVRNTLHLLVVLLGPQSWTAARWRRQLRLATAAALATTDGQVAAHGSSIAALQSSLTTGLSNKADQSAFDVLEGVVATKSTPD